MLDFFLLGRQLLPHLVEVPVERAGCQVPFPVVPDPMPEFQLLLGKSDCLSLCHSLCPTAMDQVLPLQLLEFDHGAVDLVVITAPLSLASRWIQCLLVFLDDMEQFLVPLPLSLQKVAVLQSSSLLPRMLRLWTWSMLLGKVGNV